MNIERARKIINSAETIEVLYQGNPVWIDGIHSDKSAQVHYLDRQEKIQVSVDMLVEKTAGY